MANDKRICKCCGAEYKYCPKCKKYASLPDWMWKCDTEECNEIFDVISGYNMGNRTAEQVKEVVDIFDVKDFSKFVPSIQNKLNELFGNDAKRSKKNKKKEMDIDLKVDSAADEAIVIEPVDSVLDSEINTPIVEETAEEFSNFKGISDLI